MASPTAAVARMAQRSAIVRRHASCLRLRSTRMWPAALSSALQSSSLPSAAATTAAGVIDPQTTRSFHGSATARQEASAAEEGRRSDPVMDTTSQGDEQAGLDKLDSTIATLKDGKKEYSAEVKELADRIVQLNLLEIGDLCDVLKDKMGLDQADFFLPLGAMGSAPAQGEADEEEAAPAPKEEKTHFDINVVKYDAKTKIKLIKEVRGLANLGLKEAKELVESVPAIFMKDIKKEEAEAIMEKLKEAGAEAELV